MGIFSKLFGLKQDKDVQQHNGYHDLTVSSVQKLTEDSVKISFDIPNELKSNYEFVSGQYLTVIKSIDGEELRRSYSICSGPNEQVAIAVKKVPYGKFSNWAITNLNQGDILQVSEPQGNFKLDSNARFIVSFVAGSGITPILSMVKKLENEIADFRLFYGNKSSNSVMFKSDLSNLNNTKLTYAYSQENVEGELYGRLTKEKITEIIKSDLNLLKADAYYMCGPEELILNAKSVLEMFGVSKDKIHFELFTTPVLMKQENTEAKEIYPGRTAVTVILDQEKIEFDYNAKDKTILEALNDKGFDPPYSCRGGVCCACRAKVLEGDMLMLMNYSLTDEEVKEGYVLTCQSHPTTDKIVLSYDA
jgi:ring-1,2-phenylacetyl-CoA epoxidase subunit PaaE